MLDGSFLHLFVVKFVLLLEKTENNWKRGRGWPIFIYKKLFVKTTHQIDTTISIAVIVVRLAVCLDSDTRRPEFESSQSRQILLEIYCWKGETEGNVCDNDWSKSTPVNTRPNLYKTYNMTNTKPNWKSDFISKKPNSIGPWYWISVMPYWT